MIDLFRGVRDKIDFRLDARTEYESRVASRKRILDVGGRNRTSRSRARLNALGSKQERLIVCTDIVAEYKPDIVDDICNTAIKPNSFEGVYCDAVLEHVQEYGKAIDNVHAILKNGGESFFYVPFMYGFHDLMDYHRFTFLEVPRMLKGFSEVKVFLAGKGDGFGWVLWYVATLTTISKFERLHTRLAKITDAVLKVVLSTVYMIRKDSIQASYGKVTLEEFCFYYIYLLMNHGFCAWVRK